MAALRQAIDSAEDSHRFSGHIERVKRDGLWLGYATGC